MDFLSELLSVSPWNIGLLIFLLVVFFIQIYYYLGLYYKPYKEAKALVNSNEKDLNASKKVSVIISAENEVEHLAENLPLILEQDYPNFEVIVINDGSTDETDELIESLKLKYNNLYATYIPQEAERNFGRRKLAFTLGAKAAKGNILLFIEPYSKPISENWIWQMTKDIEEDTEVVLGSTYYTKEDFSPNRLARFDNFLFNMQFLSKAIKHKPFTGTYNNVAFKRELFFNNKGFAAHLGLENGEDVFINQIVDSENTQVALHVNSFTESSVKNYSHWRSIKKNYSVARSNFKDKIAFSFSFEMFTRYIFYAVFLALLVSSIIMKEWGVLIAATLLFLIRLSIQLCVVNKAGGYFKAGKFYWSIIQLDLLQPLYNITFRTRSKRFKNLR